MTALDFPDTPVVGQLYGSASTVWRWNGTLWESTSGASGARGRVGYAQITVPQNGITTTVPVTGLSVTWTADPSRTYRTTVRTTVQSTVGGDYGMLNVMNGATSVTDSGNFLTTANIGQTFHASAVESGLSGPQTRHVTAQRLLGTGAVGIYAQPGAPGYILVEDITYEAGTSGIGVEPTAWVNATMTAPWVNFGGGRSLTSFRKRGDMVDLRINANGGGVAVAASSIFTLPPGYCPPATVDFIARESAGATFCILNILPAGQVLWYGTPANSGLVGLTSSFSITP